MGGVGSESPCTTRVVRSVALRRQRGGLLKPPALLPTVNCRLPTAYCLRPRVPKRQEDVCVLTRHEQQRWPLMRRGERRFQVARRLHGFSVDLADHVTRLDPGCAAAPSGSTSRTTTPSFRLATSRAHARPRGVSDSTVMPVGPNSGPSDSPLSREARSREGSSAPSVARTFSVFPLRTTSRSIVDPGLVPAMRLRRALLSTHLLTVDCRDDVTLLESRTRRRTTGLDATHERSAGVRQFQA